jgi:hypothetical protein
MFKAANKTASKGKVEEISLHFSPVLSRTEGEISLTPRFSGVFGTSPKGITVSTVSHTLGKPLKRFIVGKAPRHTLLKQGVNEISNRELRNSGEKCRLPFTIFTMPIGSCFGFRISDFGF